MAYSKQSKLALKNVIKNLVAQQKLLKPQRKTVHFAGFRTHPAWEATCKHLNNRYDLRHLYLAYGIMRGKSVDQIEPKRKTEFNQTKVDRIIEKYGEVICDNKE